MLFSMNIGGKPTKVSGQSIVSALTSDKKHSAVAKRSSLQQCADFIGASHHEDDIKALFDIVHAENSISFVDKILKLTDLIDEPYKAAFEGNFRLKVTQRGGNSIVTVSLSESHTASIELDGYLVLFDGVFTSVGQGEYKLKEGYANFKPIFELMSNPTQYVQNANAKHQVTTPETQEEFSFNNEMFCANLKLDLPRSKDFFPQDNAGNSRLVTKQRYMDKVVHDFEPYLESKLNFNQINVYDLFCLLPLEQQNVVFECIYGGGTAEDPLVQNFLSTFEELANDTEKKAVAALIKFRVTLEYPGTDEEFQAALKKLSPDKAVFYMVCVCQKFKHDIITRITPEFEKDKQTTLPVFKNGETEVYFYIDPRNPFEIDAEMCFPCCEPAMPNFTTISATTSTTPSTTPSPTTSTTPSQVIPIAKIKVTVNYAALAFNKAPSNIANAYNELDEARRDYENAVNPQQTEDYTGKSKKARSATFISNWEVAEKNLMAAICKADPNAVTIKFDNAVQVGVELHNRDGQKISVNKNMHLETKEEIELSRAMYNELSMLSRLYV